MNINQFRVSINPDVNRQIQLLDGNILCYESDNDIIDFVLIVDTAANYKLDLESKRDGCSHYNTISLEKSDDDEYPHVLLKAGMLFNGKNIVQIRMIDNNQVWVSDRVDVWVKKSILSQCGAYQEMGFIPSEFYQIESNLDEINKHPPTIDKSGYWSVWNPSTHRYELTDIPYSGGSATIKAGNGIKIDNDTISVLPDMSTLDFDEQGRLQLGSADLGIIV